MLKDFTTFQILRYPTWWEIGWWVRLTKTTAFQEKPEEMCQKTVWLRWCSNSMGLCRKVKFSRSHRLFILVRRSRSRSIDLSKDARSWKSTAKTLSKRIKFWTWKIAFAFHKFSVWIRMVGRGWITWLGLSSSSNKEKPKVNNKKSKIKILWIALNEKK